MHTAWEGWQRIAAIYSPFNLTNYAMELVLISPAFGAYLWLERRKKRASGSPHRMSTLEAQQIINVYGDAMTKPADFPGKAYVGLTAKDPAARQMIDELNTVLAKGGVLRDVRALPYSKERIKQALLIAIVATPPGAARDHLLTGYVMLADWQDPNGLEPMAAMAAEGKALLLELQALGLWSEHQSFP